MAQYAEKEIRFRLELSKKMFYQIESYLTDFLGYVPFDPNHLEVYSSKLVTVILEIGPELVNSLELAVARVGRGIRRLSYDDSYQKDFEDLREKEKKREKMNQSLTFNNYYRYLDRYLSPNLSSAAVRLRGYNVYTVPFETTPPDWWDAYNLLRHKKYSNLKKATLEVALKASSALYWLVDRNMRSATAESLASELFLPINLAKRMDSYLVKM